VRKSHPLRVQTQKAATCGLDDRPKGYRQGFPPPTCRRQNGDRRMSRTQKSRQAKRVAARPPLVSGVQTRPRPFSTRQWNYRYAWRECQPGILPVLSCRWFMPFLCARLPVLPSSGKSCPRVWLNGLLASLAFLMAFLMGWRLPARVIGGG